MNVLTISVAVKSLRSVCMCNCEGGIVLNVSYTMATNRNNNENSDDDFADPPQPCVGADGGNNSRTEEVPEDDVDLEPITLVQNTPRRTYLITYSQVNKRVFPSREAFAKLCAEACGGKKVVAYYACAE